ncbi:T3SS effector HopA1 family protein [Streptomyces sp. NPDC018833]|uniref:T3SS effector HopA1 family protein n=1 Tax=Streptomyces sp. NPDC018833 TaxID=3365053 RepID=UPI0037AC9BBA
MHTPEPAHLRDGERLDHIRRTVGQLLDEHAHREMSASLRESVVDRVYRKVHAGPGRGGDALHSDRAAYAAMVAEAERRLGDLTHDRPGFRLLSRAGGETVVTCPDGVDVVVDDRHVRISASGEVTVTASALSTQVGARWVYWTPPQSAGDMAARVYLHARPDDALDTWCRVVRTLHDAGIAFAAKVGGSAAMLNRTDCVVLYCSAENLAQVASAASANCAHPVDSVPGFSVALYPGVGAALAPEANAGTMAMSVGYYWARSLVEAWDTNGTDGLESVLSRLAQSWERTRRQLPVPETA